MFVVFYKHVTVGGDGVSIWSKLDGCINIQALSSSVLKYLPVIMYCKVCCCLHKINCLKTFEHMSMHCTNKALVFVKFH